MSDAPEWRRKFPMINNRARVPPLTAHRGEDDLESARAEAIMRPVRSAPTSSMPELKMAARRPFLLKRASEVIAGLYGRVDDGPDYFSNVAALHENDPAPADQMINAVFNDIVKNPIKSLAVTHNGTLLRIFEAYMNRVTENSALKEKIQAVVENHDTLMDYFEGERRRWREDEALYKQDIKRLEVMVAKGHVGLSQVSLARQQSTIRAKTMRGAPSGGTDSLASSESANSAATRAGAELLPVRRPRPNTPTHDMQLLSQKISSSDYGLGSSFRPGTVQQKTPETSLSIVEIPQDWRKRNESLTTSIPPSPARTERSDFSSHVGDMLDDEMDQKESDRNAVRHVANMIHKSSEVPMDGVVKLLWQYIDGEVAIEAAIDDVTPRPQKFSRPDSFSSATSDDMPTIQIAKSSKKELRATSSPSATQAARKTAQGRRPFSFYAGDDMSLYSFLAKSPPSSEALVAASTHSSPGPSSSRQGPLTPSPISEHVMSLPAREDSRSSIITSVHRSPFAEHGGNSAQAYGAQVHRTGSDFGADGRPLASAPTNQRPSSATDSMRSVRTTVKGPSVPKLVEHLEMNGLKQGDAAARAVPKQTPMTEVKENQKMEEKLDAKVESRPLAQTGTKLVSKAEAKAEAKEKEKAFKKQKKSPRKSKKGKETGAGN